MRGTTANIPPDVPECFGTGLTATGRLQRLSVCDDCTEARRCLLRRMQDAERPHVPARDRYDHLFPAMVRRRA